MSTNKKQKRHKLLYEDAIRHLIPFLDKQSIQNLFFTDKHFGGLVEDNIQYTYILSTNGTFYADADTLFEALLVAEEYYIYNQYNPSSRPQIPTVKLLPGVYDLPYDRDINITSPMIIAGSNAEIKGSINIDPNVSGTVLKHLTITGPLYGVRSKSSFAMENVVVHGCLNDGVVIEGPDDAEDAEDAERIYVTCTNLTVKECTGSGIYVGGKATIRLAGQTTISNNCKIYMHHGMELRGNSVLELVHPLNMSIFASNDYFAHDGRQPVMIKENKETKETKVTETNFRF